MSVDDRTLVRRERVAKIVLWMAERGTYNKSLVDKISRWLVGRLTKLKPENDFMRDPLVDDDEGFDPDELDRYQRGEL